MYLARTPAIMKPLMRELIWSMPGTGRTVHLTFDDGPIPEVTPWVLDTLAEHDAKATFFCIGRNAEANPGLLHRIGQEGHAVGNHTYDHLDGWHTTAFTYLRNVLRCQDLTGSRLFRPPYGHITRRQAKALHARFDVVMWSVLSADFDTGIDGKQCLHNVTRNTHPGAIIVFHDSLKAEVRLRYVLPRVLAWLGREGYAMKPL